MKVRDMMWVLLALVLVCAGVQPAQAQELEMQVEVDLWSLEIESRGEHQLALDVVYTTRAGKVTVATHYQTIVVGPSDSSVRLRLPCPARVSKRCGEAPFEVYARLVSSPAAHRRQGARRPKEDSGRGYRARGRGSRSRGSAPGAAARRPRRSRSAP